MASVVKYVPYSPLRPELCQASLKNTLDTPFRAKWPVLTCAAIQEIKMELERSLQGMRFTSGRNSRGTENIKWKRDRVEGRESTTSDPRHKECVVSDADTTLESDAGIMSELLGPPRKLFCKSKSEDNSESILSRSGDISTEDLAAVSFKEKEMLSASSCKSIAIETPSKNLTSGSSQILEDVPPAKIPSLDECEDCEEVVLLGRKDQLVVGLNAVTRLLERDRLITGLLCSNSPSLLHHHLLPLAVTRSVPFASVPELSKMVAELLGIKCALCIGLKKMDNEKNYFPELTSTISSLAPPLSLPWLVIKKNSLSAGRIQQEGEETSEFSLQTDRRNERIEGHGLPDSRSQESATAKKCSGVVYYPLHVKKTVNVRKKDLVKKRE